MNRRSFLTRLGLGAVAATIAPRVLSAPPEKKVIISNNPDFAGRITSMRPSRTPLDTICEAINKKYTVKYFGKENLLGRQELFSQILTGYEWEPMLKNHCKIEVDGKRYKVIGFHYFDNYWRAIEI